MATASYAAIDGAAIILDADDTIVARFHAACHPMMYARLSSVAIDAVRTYDRGGVPTGMPVPLGTGTVITDFTLPASALPDLRALADQHGDECPERPSYGLYREPAWVHGEARLVVTRREHFHAPSIPVAVVADRAAAYAWIAAARAEAARS